MNEVISQATNITDIVDAVNNLNDQAFTLYFGGSYVGDAKTMAADYAVHCVWEDILENNIKISEFEDAIHVHLDCLKEAGAEFDHDSAYWSAINKLYSFIEKELTDILYYECSFEIASGVYIVTGEEMQKEKEQQPGNFPDYDYKKYYYWIHDDAGNIGQTGADTIKQLLESCNQ